jgi:hypothetical protein
VNKGWITCPATTTGCLPRRRLGGVLLLVASIYLEPPHLSHTLSLSPSQAPPLFRRKGIGLVIPFLLLSPFLSFFFLAMRSFAPALTILSLPLFALAASHGRHPRGHAGLAARARGDVLDKRDFSGRLTYYDITVGLYVPLHCPHFPSLIISTARPVVEVSVQATT